MNPTVHAIPIEAAARRRLIGTYLRDAGKLAEADLARVAERQRERGLRFGEAAVDLRLVDEADVRTALAAQFDCPPGAHDADPELELLADPSGRQAEAFRELRSRLLLEALPEGAPITLGVLSARPGDGRTYVAANLALAFSQTGSRTLLVDADLRGARLHRLLRVEGGTGLSHVLAGFADLGEAVQRVSGVADLWLLPAGALPPNPAELLERPALESLLDSLKTKFDRVVIDTTASSRGPDCRVVAARCTASILVARRNEARMDELHGLADAVGRGPAAIAGVVVNER